MHKINSIYYGGVASYPYSAWLYEYANGDEAVMKRYRDGECGIAYTEEGYYRGYDSWSGRFSRSVEEGVKYKEERESIFRKQFLPIFKSKRGEWFQFIITNLQLPNFLRDIKENNLEHLIKYSSPEPAFNSNYPEDGPKLHFFLLKSE